LAVSYAAELARFGVDTTIVVPGAFTTGTNHYANAGVRRYAWARVRVPTAWRHAFSENAAVNSRQNSAASKGQRRVRRVSPMVRASVADLLRQQVTELDPGGAAMTG